MRRILPAAHCSLLLSCWPPAPQPPGPARGAAAAGDLDRPGRPATGRGGARARRDRSPLRRRAKRVCYDKFFVTSCLDEAKERRRSGLAAQRAIEVQAERFKRQAGGRRARPQTGRAEKKFREEEAALAEPSRQACPHSGGGAGAARVDRAGPRRRARCKIEGGAGQGSRRSAEARPDVRDYEAPQGRNRRSASATWRARRRKGRQGGQEGRGRQGQGGKERQPGVNCKDAWWGDRCRGIDHLPTTITRPASASRPCKRPDPAAAAPASGSPSCNCRPCPASARWPC
jgi:colicin import membrane protein